MRPRFVEFRDSPQALPTPTAFLQHIVFEISLPLVERAFGVEQISMSIHSEESQMGMALGTVMTLLLGREK